jgi:hypothetical protein
VGGLLVETTGLRSGFPVGALIVLRCPSSALQITPSTPRRKPAPAAD